MTAPALPRTAEPTRESERLRQLHAMLDDPAQAEHWDDIRGAIDYLTVRATVSALLES